MEEQADILRGPQVMNMTGSNQGMYNSYAAISTYWTDTTAMDNLRAAAELTAHGTQQAVSLRTNMTALASVFTGSSHQDTMSLSLPLVKEWSTNIKTFVHHRMTLLDAISAGSASFDILCRPGVYTLYIASMTNKVPFHPMSGSPEVTNAFNNKFGDP